MKTLFLLHGYGVRSFFWDELRAKLDGSFAEVVTPDIEAQSFHAYCEEVERLLVARREEDGEPSAVAGHSLGAVIAAAAARTVGEEVTSRVVMMAPPGTGESSQVGPVLRFFLRHRLIPDFMIRPRFFVQAPTAVQKRLFQRAVVESPGLQDDVYQRRAALVEEIASPLAQPSLVITSDADQIVPSDESVALAERLGARVHRFSQGERVGHDDYGTAPAVVSAVANLIVEFCGVGRR